MTTINEINQTIISGSFTNEQLDSIIMAVKFARNQITAKNRGQMVIGTQVKFTHPKTGKELSGDVIKVARKFITVKTGVASTWRVPANMLDFA